HVHNQVFTGADVDGERGRRHPVEPDAGAVGRGGKELGSVAAVDLDGVDPVTALVQVGVVARVPDHAVVTGLAEYLVVAVPAGQDVAAVPAEQGVEAPLAEQDV